MKRSLQAYNSVLQKFTVFNRDLYLQHGFIYLLGKGVAGLEQFYRVLYQGYNSLLILLYLYWNSIQRPQWGQRSASFSLKVLTNQHCLT